MATCRMRKTGLSKSLCERDLRVLDACGHYIRQQCDLAAEKPNTTSGQVSRSIVFRVWKKTVLRFRTGLDRAGVWPHSGCQALRNTQENWNMSRVSQEEKGWKSCHMRSNWRNDDCSLGKNFLGRLTIC